MAVLAVPPYLRFFDLGTPPAPLNGGKVYTYAAGTTTPKATFTDYTEVTQAANPIVLDSNGMATIWINGSYRFDVFDALGNLIRSTDNITSFTVPSAAANTYFQSFSGDASTKIFTTSSNLGTDPKAIFVWIDAGGGKGYDIINPNAYTIAGTTLTFITAPASGTNNIYVSAPLLLVNSASAAASAAATSATASATSATASATSATASASSATAAASSATSASSSASTATTQASNASTSATNAASSATTASTQATNAATSATAAAASAVLAGTALTTTSTTSLAIGTGSKTFTTQANKNFFAGQTIIAASNANAANYMHGQVTSYSGTSLVINVLDIGGSGTLADWNISVSGTQGTAGGVTTTGSPASGNLAKFSGVGTITNTDLTGDITTSGTVATTLATVNSNVGSFTAANITVNAKGLITAASNGSASEVVLLGSATASASATLSFASMMTSSYNQYLMVFNDLLTSTSASIKVGFSKDNGANYDRSPPTQVAIITTGGSTAPAFFGGTASPTPITSGIAASKFSGYINMTTGTTNFTLKSCLGASVNNFVYEATACDTESSAINAVQLSPSAGTFTSGTVYLYGVKNT